MKFLFLSFLLAFSVLIHDSHGDSKPPVFLVNGILGSKLFIEEKGVQYLPGCKATAGYRKIWIADTLATVNGQRCELNLLSPVFNQSTGEFHDLLGTNVSSPFGDPDSLQCLNRSPGWLCLSFGGLTGTGYYYWFIGFLTRLGYVLKQDLISAPYDWRFPANSKRHLPYFQMLKDEIEKSFDRTKLKAIIVAHSMGNKLINFFLSDRVTTKEWRQKYINCTFNAGPAYGGSVATMEELATGHDITVAKYVQIIDRKVVRDFGRSLPAMASLLPSPNVYDAKKPLVTIADKAYTIENMNEFLTLINSSHLAAIRGGSEESQPDVKMVVVLGTGKDTPASYKYKDSVDKDPDTIYVDGDGRIQSKAMEDLCKKWQSKGADIEVLQVKDMEHTALIASFEFFDIFRDRVIGKLPEGELYPRLQNFVEKRGRDICFSADPWPVCPLGTTEIVLKEAKSVPFVCFSKEDELIVQLENETKAGRFFELNPEKAAFIAGIEIPARCIKI